MSDLKTLRVRCRAAFIEAVDEHARERDPDHGALSRFVRAAIREKMARDLERLEAEGDGGAER